MSKCKFKVGDYVICNKSDFWSINKGWIGQVKSVLPTGKITLAGNGCVLTTDKINCFDLYIKDQPSKIVITTDGKTTTAKLYRDKTLLEVQTTKCHPDDRFDFKVGAKIAFDRLMECKKEEPIEYYNGKIVCTNTGGTIFTKGKIYEFIDGQFIADDGIKYPTHRKIKSFEDWTDNSTGEWLEVVE